MSHAHAVHFGESRLRLLRLIRRGDRHDPQDLTIAIRCEGRAGLPLEPLNNLVCRVVADRQHVEIEALAVAIATRIVAEHADVQLARVEAAEEPWRRLEAGGKAQGQAFTPSGGERRVAIATTNGTRTALTAGADHLVVMRSAGLQTPGREAGGSDAAEGAAPPFVGVLSARWVYTSTEIAFGSHRQGIRAAIVDTFAWHAKRSTYNTLVSIADVILASYEEVTSVTLSAEERPYRPVDLLELSVARDAIFAIRDEPLATVEITVER
jgi:urate oxidase